MPNANESKLPLTSMDAGLLREIAAKVDDDLIDVNDAKVLRGIAESVDRVLEWCEGARSKEEVEEILFGNAEQPKDVTLKPWDGRPLTPHPSVIVDEKRKRIIGILEEYPDANAEDTWLKVADAILALWQPEQASDDVKRRFPPERIKSLMEIAAKPEAGHNSLFVIELLDNLRQALGYDA